MSNKFRRGLTWVGYVRARGQQRDIPVWAYKKSCEAAQIAMRQNAGAEQPSMRGSGILSYYCLNTPLSLASKCIMTQSEKTPEPSSEFNFFNEAAEIDEEAWQKLGKTLRKTEKIARTTPPSDSRIGVSYE